MPNLSETLNQIIDVRLGALMEKDGAGIPLYQGMEQPDLEFHEKEISRAIALREEIIKHPEAIHAGLTRIGVILARTVSRAA